MDEGPKIGWEDLLKHWALIELDLLEQFSLDIADPALVRSWPWWRDRILALLSTPSRIHRALSAS